MVRREFHSTDHISVLYKIADAPKYYTLALYNAYRCDRVSGCVWYGGMNSVVNKKKTKRGRCI